MGSVSRVVTPILAGLCVIEYVPTASQSSFPQLLYYLRTLSHKALRGVFRVPHTYRVLHAAIAPDNSTIRLTCQQHLDRQISTS